MAHQVKEAIMQLLDSTVLVAHTGVDTEAAKKLQSFFDNFVGIGEKPEATPQLCKGVTSSRPELRKPGSALTEIPG